MSNEICILWSYRPAIEFYKWLGKKRMNEGWNVPVSFLPEDREGLARATGAPKGLRRDKSADVLLRTFMLHLQVVTYCGKP